MRRYDKGLDVLGQDTNRGVLIRVKDPGALARSQGAVASFAQSLAPATIEGKVYDELAKQLKDALREKHVDADVNVVESAAWRPAGSSHIWTDVGFAVGGAGILAGILYLLGRLK